MWLVAALSGRVLFRSGLRKARFTASGSFFRDTVTASSFRLQEACLSLGVNGCARYPIFFPCWFRLNTLAAAPLVIRFYLLLERHTNSPGSGWGSPHEARATCTAAPPPSEQAGLAGDAASRLPRKRGQRKPHGCERPAGRGEGGR